MPSSSFYLGPEPLLNIQNSAPQLFHPLHDPRLPLALLLRQNIHEAPDLLHESFELGRCPIGNKLPPQRSTISISLSLFSSLQTLGERGCVCPSIEITLPIPSTKTYFRFRERKKGARGEVDYLLSGPQKDETVK
jgi:hypothetical protein